MPWNAACGVDPSFDLQVQPTNINEQNAFGSNQTTDFYFGELLPPLYCAVSKNYGEGFDTFNSKSLPSNQLVTMCIYIDNTDIHTVSNLFQHNF